MGKSWNFQIAWVLPTQFHRCSDSPEQYKLFDHHEKNTENRMKQLMQEEPLDFSVKPVSLAQFHYIFSPRLRKISLQIFWGWDKAVVLRTYLHVSCRILKNKYFSVAQISMYSVSTLFNYPPGKNSSYQWLQRCSFCRLLSASHCPPYVSTLFFFFFFKVSCCKAIEQVTGSKHRSGLEGNFLLCLSLIKCRHPTSELFCRQSFPLSFPQFTFHSHFSLAVSPWISTTSTPLPKP